MCQLFIGGSHRRMNISAFNHSKHLLTFPEVLHLRLGLNLKK